PGLDGDHAGVPADARAPRRERAAAAARGAVMEIVQLFATFLILMLAGAPVATSMLLASILNVMLFGIPETIVAERMLNSINSFTLLAVPFFILSGVIMNRGGLTTRMVEVSKAF